MLRSGRTLSTLLAVCWAAYPGLADNRDLAFLLDGVTEIAAPGVPGPLCVFGDRAFPVVAGGDKKLREPVVAAARMGRGRIVTFGHDGYLGSGTLASADTGRLMLNAVRWVAASDATQNPAPRVAVHKHRGLQEFLRNEGIKAEALDKSDWPRRLKEFDVLCCSSHSLSDTDMAEVRHFVRGGGGLVTAGLGWGWLQLHPGQSLEQHPGNRLLASAGIVWADGHLKRTTEEGYSAAEPPSDLCHAARALDTLVAHAGGKTSRSAEDTAQAVWVVTRAARNLPPSDKLLRPKLRRLRTQHADDIIPTSKDPVTMKQPLDRLLLTLQIEQAKSLPPGRIKAHSAAESFPWAVPADAQEVVRGLEIDTGVPGWHSTGLYARPGRVIAIEAPPVVAGRKLRVRIGAHQDRLWGKDTWKRCPDICRTWVLDQGSTRAANAFGGPIYIDVPKGCRLGTISLKIRNAVEAPHYVLGVTDLKAWREKIRHRPAPWAELESGKMILTVPSTVVRDLDDPEALMRFWDDVADACAELAARPLERKRPERYVADRQISAGYMHAGYPIMTHLDATEVMVDVERMKTNSHGGVWGLFHELGHNHQSRDWTFGGTGEVTVNLFTLYVFDKVCGRYEESRPKLFGESRAKTIGAYLDAGADFNEWKRKPFLALLMYMQIRETFGWDAFKKVFAEYRDLPKNQRPRDDAEKRDQWLVRLSRTVGRNLSPFFETWGVPTSEEARASIVDLPVWMPADFPPE